MKSTASVSFIIATLLYGVLLLAGYWLFSLAINVPKPLPDKISALPITLNMFQPETATPIIQAIVTPPEVEAKAIEEPIVEPMIKPNVKPVVEPIIEPKPAPKPEPITAKASIKKPELTVVPVVEKQKAVKPKPPKSVEKPVEKPIAKAEAQSKVEVEPIAPQENTQISAQQQANAEQTYLHALRTEILLHAQDTYPRRAKRRHWEGIVTLSFTLLPSGKILGLTVQKSSGRQILDDAATSIFQRKMHNQFQPFPPEITRKAWKITIPVSYHLR